MKRELSLILLSVIVCFGAAGQTASTASQDFKKLSWMEGTWNRTNAKPGRTAHERWVKSGAQEMKGWGVSMNGTDTAFVEKLKLIVKDNSVFYVAEVPGNNGETLFKLTQVSDKNAVFENPQHDFPKKIEYTLDGKKLKATISADGKAMDYLFEKK